MPAKHLRERRIDYRTGNSIAFADPTAEAEAGQFTSDASMPHPGPSRADQTTSSRSSSRIDRRPIKLRYVQRKLPLAASCHRPVA
jgi:hypothetical protein